MNINDLFDLKRQADEIRRKKDLFDKIDAASMSIVSQQLSAMNEIKRNSFADLHNSFQDRTTYLKILRNPLDELTSSIYVNALRLNEKSINSSFSKNLQNFHDLTSQNIKKIVEDTLYPFSTTKLLNETVKSKFEQLGKSLISPFQSIHSNSLKSLEQTTRATTLTSIEAMAKSFSDNNSLFRNDLFMNQFSTSLLNYNQFTNTTLARLNFGIDKNIEYALKGSLTLANEQIIRSTGVIQSFVNNSNLTDLYNSSHLFDRVFPKVNRYRVQKQELLKREDIENEEEYESLVIKSPSAISFEQISNCMTLIGLCNEASETTKGNIIFTLTSTLWLSAWKLMGLVPTNKDSFAIVVDCLYLMLYEGAGKDKLRFIEQGYINADEAELIWKIKHLRNKWLRHDINHGKENDIKKSYQHRKEALEWFGLGKVPYSRDEFIFLYNNLIFKVEDFLKLLLERVSKFSN